LRLRLLAHKKKQLADESEVVDVLIYRSYDEPIPRDNSVVGYFEISAAFPFSRGGKCSLSQQVQSSPLLTIQGACHGENIAESEWKAVGCGHRPSTPPEKSTFDRIFPHRVGSKFFRLNVFFTDRKSPDSIGKIHFRSDLFTSGRI
jgi:hypothetical protein